MIPLSASIHSNARTELPEYRGRVALAGGNRGGPGAEIP